MESAHMDFVGSGGGAGQIVAREINAKELHIPVMFASLYGHGLPKRPIGWLTFSTPQPPFGR